MVHRISSESNESITSVLLTQLRLKPDDIRRASKPQTTCLRARVACQFLVEAAYATAPPATNVSTPVVTRKPVSIIKPSNDPSSDILTRNSLDLISITINRTTVALRPAILVALMGQRGSSGGSIDSEQFAYSAGYGSVLWILLGFLHPVDNRSRRWRAINNGCLTRESSLQGVKCDHRGLWYTKGYGDLLAG